MKVLQNATPSIGSVQYRFGSISVRFNIGSIQYRFGSISVRFNISSVQIGSVLMKKSLIRFEFGSVFKVKK